MIVATKKSNVIQQKIDKAVEKTNQMWRASICQTISRVMYAFIIVGLFIAIYNSGKQAGSIKNNPRFWVSSYMDVVDYNSRLGVWDFSYVQGAALRNVEFALVDGGEIKIISNDGIDRPFLELVWCGNNDRSEQGAKVVAATLHNPRKKPVPGSAASAE